MVSFDRSPFKLFSLRFSNKSVQAPSCGRPKTAPRTIFLLFANNCIPISASCRAATNFSHHTLICNNGIAQSTSSPIYEMTARIGSPSWIFSNNAKSPSDIWSVGKEPIVNVEFTTWPASITDFFKKLRHYTVIGKQFLISLTNIGPLTGWGLRQFVWKFSREQLKARLIEWYHCQPAYYVIGQYL